ENLLLPGIAFKGFRPPLFRIVQLLLYFLVNFGSAALQCIVDFRYGVLYLFAVDGTVARWLGVVKLRGGNPFGIFPEFIQLPFDLLPAVPDGIALHKGVPIRVGLDLRPVGVKLLYTQQPLFASQQHDLRENGPETALQTLPPETVDRIVVRPAHTGKP